MNKDLPLKVRHIFKDLDPVIWEGTWLNVLNKLLTGNAMPIVWQHIINEATENKKRFPLITKSQFIKWELKAFVAQAVNSVNKNYNKKIFIVEFENYFSKKGYKVNKDMITKIYESIYI
tara:strand:- start:910 stop:1266 length:357 start_codon:yes stop_codon:yes gene_type:complete